MEETELQFDMQIESWYAIKVIVHEWEAFEWII